MEQSPNSSLFSLTIDPVTKAHLFETARWARFLAIVGMIFLVLMVAAGVVLSTTLSSQMSGAGMGSFETGFGAGLAFVYIIFAVIAFFPLMYLLRFANKTRVALNGNDQQALNESLQNLKIYFRYLGIITIIILALYIMGFVFGVLGAALFA